MLRHALPVICLALSSSLLGVAAELRVPAFTAYMLPNPDSARFSEARGITRWNDARESVNWYGKFEREGTVRAEVDLRMAPGSQASLKLTIDGQSRELVVKGAEGEAVVTADFGSFSSKGAGYKRIQLEALGGQPPNGGVESLRLFGDAVEGTHFNLKERRNAASVHLMYPVPADTQIEAFYCEITAVEDPSTTFYMACGWHRGYFGMQVNSATERRIIFSVWDSGDEGVDRNKVASENRVRLEGKGANVFTGDFGNEGTGGHSHLKVMWKTGEKQRFIVTAKPIDKTFTIFSGYWYHPEDKQWMLISSWRAPKEGGWIKRPHSFSENFGGSSGHLLRKALYGNQWVRTSEGKWLELTQASFSHDPTGKADRLDRFMGVQDGEFFLSHGGFREGFTEYGTKFSRPASGSPPANLTLPDVKHAGASDANSK